MKMVLTVMMSLFCCFTVIFAQTGGCAFTVDIAITDATCGNADGSATVTVTNGVDPLIIFWSNGNQDEQADNLYSGLYFVDVIDASGCIEHLEFIIGDDCQGPPNDSTLCTEIYDPVCVTGVGTFPNSCWAELLGFPNWVSGECDSGPGGPPPPPPPPTGCDFQVDFQVTEATCGNADGSISITVTGDNPPFDITWANGTSGSTSGNLSAGFYLVDVTDATGCVEHLCIIVTDDCQGPPNDSTICNEIIDPVCVDGVGTFPNSCWAEFFGFPNWVQGECPDDPIDPGDCNCPAVWDPVCADGITFPNDCEAICAGINDFELGECDIDPGDPPFGCAFEVDFTVTEATCGNADGSINITVTGDNPPFNITLLDGTAGNALDNLSAGIYFIEVTDATGCLELLTIIVSEDCQGPPNDSTLCTEIYDPVCVDGVGTFPNSCWAELLGFPNWVQGECPDDPIDPDDCNCPAIWDPVCVDGITFPNDCEATCAGFDDFEVGECDGNSGDPCNCPEIWDPVCADGLTLPNACIAQCLGFSDFEQGGCDGSGPIDPPTACDFQVDFVVTDASCGNADGAIDINVTGDNPPFDITWADGASGDSAIDLAPGFYLVDVTDATGCVEHLCIIVGDDCQGPPDDTPLCLEIYEPVCVDGVGTFPNSCWAEFFGFPDWVDGECDFDGPGTQDIYGCTDPFALNYNPFATVDDGSCYFGISSEYQYENPHSSEVLNFKEILTIDAITYPNPASTQVTIEVDLKEEDRVTFNVVNLLGQQVYSATSRMAPGTNTQRINISNLEEGSYWLQISTEKGAVHNSKLVKTK
ncbi:MAG: T9SS type A sorting domain-containing protein [Bacteroidota bacterium]